MQVIQHQDHKLLLSNLSTLFFTPEKEIVHHEQKIQQNENQSQELLIAALLKGNLKEAKNLKLQGASLTEPDANGTYPLSAAVYGANPDAVKYIESNLQCEAKKQWEKVDARKAIYIIEKTMPNNLPTEATYRELGSWYINNTGMPWMEKYDNDCLVMEGREK